MGLLIIQLLKWILRILLCLLLVFILLLLLVLLVPIRYKMQGSYQKADADGEGAGTEDAPVSLKLRAGWLFSFISFRLSYEQELHYRLRILGIPVIRNDKKTDKRKKDRKEASEPEADFNQSRREVPPAQTDDSSTQTNTSSARTDDSPAQTDAVPEVKKIPPDSSGDAGYTRQTEPDKPKISLLDRLRSIWEKILAFLRRIKEICHSAQEKKALAEHYLELWKREETQITFKRCKRKLGKMIKALLPRRWEVSGDIGFSDPATTGQMMAAIGMVYPFVGKHIYISPDFEQEQMKLSGYAKGHIRLGYYLYLVVSLLLNKYCIAFIKMIFNEFFNDNNNKQEVANDRE